MRKAKVDRNQPLAAAALRALGFLVHPTHALGKGAPDLLVSGESQTGPRLLWLELKCGSWLRPPSSVAWIDTLTSDEHKFLIGWEQAPVMINNRVRYVLERFCWSDDEIRAGLAALPDDPGVKAALRKIERKYGLVEEDVLATILYE